MKSLIPLLIFCTILMATEEQPLKYDLILNVAVAIESPLHHYLLDEPMNGIAGVKVGATRGIINDQLSISGELSILGPMFDHSMKINKISLGVTGDYHFRKNSTGRTEGVSFLKIDPYIGLRASVYYMSVKRNKDS